MKIEEIKRFLMPEWRKIALTIAILLATFLFEIKPLVFDAVIRYRGLPLPYWGYYQAEGPMLAYFGITPSSTYLGFLLYSNLIVDVIFWYLVSSLIVYIYKAKVKK